MFDLGQDVQLKMIKGIMEIGTFIALQETFYSFMHLWHFVFCSVTSAQKSNIVHLSSTYSLATTIAKSICKRRFQLGGGRHGVYRGKSC
jgi:hypothetical protein